MSQHLTLPAKRPSRFTSGPPVICRSDRSGRRRAHFGSACRILVRTNTRLHFGYRDRGRVESPGEITALLREWDQRKSPESGQLFELVYPQLRRTAGALFRRERPEHLLQPTGVVNELFLRLVQLRQLNFADRQHFYRFAARLMRRILVDHARSEKRQKRDGGVSVPLEDGLAWVESNPTEMLDLDRALEELESIDPRKCRMIELRYLMGFTSEETADLMELSKASVDRDLRFTKSWLQGRLKRSS